MKIRPFSVVLLIALYCLSVLLAGCSTSNKKSKLVWSQDIPVIGSQSSPRAADLNGDSVLDIVIGAGKNEYQESEHGVMALDGKTGQLLWKQKSRDQVYGTPTLFDVTGDNVKDVFVGGRSPQLKALNGKTGSLLWEYDVEKYSNDPVLKYARFNFNNCIRVPDQNNNGSDELLTVNGGNSYDAPYSTENRFPAVLMLIDAKSGDVIAADTMPDGKESYMSPLLFTKPDNNELFIVFGTGGETIDGNLYITTVADLLAKKLSHAKKIAEETKHGFIAPASLADLNRDGYLDIVVISHGSKAIAINGKDHSTLWTQKFPGTECSNSFAVGYLNEDDVPDFFTFVSRGEWPNSTGTLQVMINGKNGAVEYTDSIGCTGFSSPVVYDLNDDGRDEVIISVNEFDCSLGYAAASPPPSTTQNKLIAIDCKTRDVRVIDQAAGFKNVFTTPWIGDMDRDGYLDLVHCQYYHYSNMLSFLGMRIRRIDLPAQMEQPVRWGAYLGSDGNGIFKGGSHK